METATGLKGGVQAGVIQTGGSASSPDIWDILNPFDVRSATQEVGQIAHKAEGVGSFVGSSRQQEKAGEKIGQAVNPVKLLQPIAKGLEELVGAYGLRLGEILGGAALILFGLATLAKGGRAPSLPGPIG